MNSTNEPSHNKLLGSPAAAFMRTHWQKSSKLIRQAMPGFNGLLDAAQLKKLACRDDVESRLIIREGKHWELEHGPFSSRALRDLPPESWTILISGLNLLDARADALLRQFAFIPFARLDDLMVSLAAPGGGVGPHVDSYDVFLLQGHGRRRWRYGAQTDFSIKPKLPVKILQHFKPEFDEILHPGDMLYLPPNIGHDGIAIEECSTYSIGFRTADFNEIAAAFLHAMADELNLSGQYTDPHLKPTCHPAEISTAMTRQITHKLREIRWQQADVARFLGLWLSEPKAHVFFNPPELNLSKAQFAKRLENGGATLDARTQLLYDEARFYLNGEALETSYALTLTLRLLADQRRIDSGQYADEFITLLWHWYRFGYLQTP